MNIKYFLDEDFDKRTSFSFDRMLLNSFTKHTFCNNALQKLTQHGWGFFRRSSFYDMIG